MECNEIACTRALDKWVILLIERTRMKEWDRQKDMSSSHNANSNSSIYKCNGHLKYQRQRRQRRRTTTPTRIISNELLSTIELNSYAVSLLVLSLNKSKNKQVALYFHNYTIFSRSSFRHLHLILCAWSECVFAERKVTTTNSYWSRGTYAVCLYLYMATVTHFSAL